MTELTRRVDAVVANSARRLLHRRLGWPGVLTTSNYRCCDCCADYNTGDLTCSLCNTFMWRCRCYAHL